LSAIPNPNPNMTRAISDLVVAFPPQAGYRGASTTVQDLARHGLYPGHLGTTPTLKAAVRLIGAARMEISNASGSGNRARRRLASR